MTEPSHAHPEEPDRVVIRDKRRADLRGDSVKPPARPRAKGPGVGGPGEAADAARGHPGRSRESAGGSGGGAGEPADGSRPRSPRHGREQPPEFPREVVIEPGGEAAGEPAGGAPSGEPAGGAPEGGPSGEPTGGPPSGTPAGGAPSGRPAGAPEPAVAPPAGLGAELEALRTALDERTRDLQRVTAEYANYRKRVERDRALVGEQATGNVLSALLPVLDDLDRARDHGELADGVAAVAEQLVATLAKFGLTAFGEKGDPFDPTHHEAVAHLTSPEVTEPTCIEVLRRGYLLGDRLLRPAMVAVADPGEPS